MLHFIEFITRRGGFIEFSSLQIVFMQPASVCGTGADCMNTIKAVVGAVILAVITIISAGCGETERSQYNRTFFPTNHWKVVGQGTDGEVVVETLSTNLLVQFRVHKAISVGTLTNGQSVRVEMVIRPPPYLGGRVRVVSSKAYPAMD